jgi:hypothetical protein
MHFANTLLAHGAPEMVEHHGTEHDVELRVGKWQ